MRSTARPALAVLAFVVAAVGPVWPQAEAPWQHPLYLDGGGYWSLRVPIDVQNASDRDVRGAVQEISVGQGPGLLPLVGAGAQALRVCDEQGRELLHEVTAQDGSLRHQGKLQAGDKLFFTVECPAGQTRRYWVYAGNERAWAVPDYLRPGLVNGGVEAGRDGPEGWSESTTDAQHTVSWVAEQPHTGKRCLKTVVQPGAEATWVKWHQPDIPVVPGVAYELTAWVRAQDAQGTVGWFLHVNGDRPQIINQVLNAGEGTYDWKQIQFRFEAPPDAVSATVGTVLYGTGTAWFDDVSLAAVDPKLGCQVRIGPRQSLKLAEDLPPATWYDDDPADNVHWSRRWPVRIFNLTSEPQSSVLVRADARPVLGRLGRPVGQASLRLVRDGRVMPHWLDGQQLLFLAQLSARTISRCDLYATLSPGRQPAPELTPENLVASPANLVRNPSFEQGGERPDGWTISAQSAGGEILCPAQREVVNGNACARLEVPPGVAVAWPGWHQEIPVRPDTTYFYAGRLKSENVEGEARLHAHLHNAAGQMVSSGGYVSTSPAVSGTTDWTRSSTFFRTPPDTASIELHLTMNTHGTVWHDDIILAEATAADVGPLESPPARQPGGTLSVWQVNPLVKAFPDEPPGLQPKEIVVRLARNEYEPFQLVLRSANRLPQVEVDVPRPTGPRGAALPEVAVNPVGFVPVDHPSAYYSSDLPAWYRLIPTGEGSSDGWAGEWPDPLPPYKPFDLEPNRAQPVWFTVQAPPDASPGEYRSTVVVRAAQGARVAIPLRVQVWEFALPATSHCKAIYDLRGGPGGDVFAAPNPEEHLRQWYRFMAQHRVAPDGFRPEPRFEYRNGQVVMDTTEWDKMAHYCLDELGMNVFYTPWFFYAMGWSYPPKSYFGLEPFTDEYNRAFTSMYRQFMDHLKAKGWHDKVVFYISDEPNLGNQATVENMKKLCRLAQAVDPQVRIYSSTWSHQPEWDGYLTLWGVGPHGSFGLETMRQRRQAGDELWFTTDGHMCIDTPYLAVERLLPHLCFKYDVSGYEFWGISWWTYDPWQRGWHTFIRQSEEGKVYRWVRYPDGDGYLTYPGATVGQDEPVSSIRLEQAREGMEDYEYLVLLRDLIAQAPPGPRKAAAEQVLAQAQQLVTIPNQGGLRSTSLMPDPDLVLAIREKIGEQIAELAKAGG